MKSELAENSAFTLPQDERERILAETLRELTAHHQRNCPPYARLLKALGQEATENLERVEDVPWLPVSLFKQHDLRSVPEDRVFRVLTSSGTTGTGPSKVYLDREAAANQPKYLARTLGAVCGSRRLPMLIIDGTGLAGDRRSFSARAAGVVGTSVMGRDHAYLLDHTGAAAEDVLIEFIRAHGDQPFLIFGFTFLVWLHLVPLLERGDHDLSKGLLLHSGGWKRLTEQAVGDGEFRRRLQTLSGLTQVSNYYGMVEQLGTIFVQPPQGGDLYCPNFADVIIRDPETLREQPIGTPGLIEVVSSVPRSYPGHALLTEDLGVVNGVDDGHWPGKHFSVLGRLPKAEARGCSDTLEVER